MNINLGAQWEGFIGEHVKSGRYLSASEVVREGLRLLQEKEQFRQLRMDELRSEVDKGLESLDQGVYLELAEPGLKTHLEDANRRGLERLAKKSVPSK